MTSSHPLPDDDALRHPDTGRVLLAMLAQGRHAARWSLLLTVAAVVLLAVGVLHEKNAADWTAAWRNPPAAALWLSLLAGVAQRYYALRVALDASLFSRLYARPMVDDHDLLRLDNGLALLGGRKDGAPGGAPRGLRSRWMGALRLLRRQLACCALQALCLLGAGVLAWIS
ncbi:hypothetical protein [Achromobacter aloeverae]